MMELIREAFGAHNLPLTLLLIMVICYWLFVFLGAVDVESSVVDFSDIGGGEEGHFFQAGGAWLTAGRFLGFANVPMAVWGSFLILFMWGTALVLNYRFNGEPGEREVTQAIFLLFPNLVLSLIVTRLVTIPVGRLYGAMAGVSTEAEEVLGRIGTVVSGEVTERYGQLKIAGAGASLLVNVRIGPHSPTLKKGDFAKILSASPDHTWYYVVPAKTT